MVSDGILSSYMGTEVIVRLGGKNHISGVLEEKDDKSVLLVQTNGKTERIQISDIKGIERRPEGHSDFESKVNAIIQKAITAGEAKDEKEAIELLNRKMSH